MNRQRRMAGLIVILGLILGFGIWQQHSQAARQAGDACPFHNTPLTPLRGEE